LTQILNTDHHNDHTSRNLELKQGTNCKIVGSRNDRYRIPGINVAVDEGDTFDLGNVFATIFDVSGHSLGHIAYWFEENKKAFCGGSVFAIGCGRVIVGELNQIRASLEKLEALPGETLIYCAPLQKTLGPAGAEPVGVFTGIRKRKEAF